MTSILKKKPVASFLRGFISAVRERRACEGLVGTSVSLQALIKNGYKNVNVVYRYRMKLSTHTD